MLLDLWPLWAFLFLLMGVTFVAGWGAGYRQGRREGDNIRATGVPARPGATKLDEARNAPDPREVDELTDRLLKDARAAGISITDREVRAEAERLLSEA